ncbi:MAG: hypothetical protein WC974_01450 [Thermoplasmata archaeon]
MEKKTGKQKISMLVAALVFFASILVVVNIGETNATATALNATDTAYLVGDTFTIRQTYLYTGLTTNFTYTVVGEETINGVLCSKITVESSDASDNQQTSDHTSTKTIWISKSSIVKSEIKSETITSGTDLSDNTTKYLNKAVMIVNITGTRTSISTNDTWSETISKKSESTNTYGNATTNNTYYDNYTQNYTVISDSRGVVVPAGTFSCYAINASMSSTNTSYEVFYITDKWPVKREDYVLNDTTHMFEKFLIEELVSYKSAPGGTGAVTAKKGFVPGFEFALLALASVSAVCLKRKR